MKKEISMSFVVLSYKSTKGDILCSYPPLPVSSLQVAGLISKPQHPVGVQVEQL